MLTACLCLGLVLLVSIFLNPVGVGACFNVAVHLTHSDIKVFQRLAEAMAIKRLMIWAIRGRNVRCVKTLLICSQYYDGPLKSGFSVKLAVRPDVMEANRFSVLLQQLTSLM